MFSVAGSAAAKRGKTILLGLALLLLVPGGGIVIEPTLNVRRIHDRSPFPGIRLSHMSQESLAIPIDGVDILRHFLFHLSAYFWTETQSKYQQEAEPATACERG